jgi:hypothetical protein
MELPIKCLFNLLIYILFSLLLFRKKIQNPVFPSRGPLKSESSDESDANKKLSQVSRKKKKEKKKKRKHQHRKKTKRKHGQSSSSGCESDAGSGKDPSSRSLRGSQKESEKPRWVAVLF